MAITEKERRELFDGLESAIGPKAANNLMELLPNTPAALLVTREDMQANTPVLRSEMAELRSELKGEVAELRAELKGEMAELRSELKGEMTELRSELRGEMAELRGATSEGFATAKVETQRLIVAGMAANTVAVVTALLL